MQESNVELGFYYEPEIVRFLKVVQEGNYNLLEVK